MEPEPCVGCARNATHPEKYNRGYCYGCMNATFRSKKELKHGIRWESDEDATKN